MRTFWKVFAALALMLPLGAFVAGTLVASAADEPDQRDTIVIRDSGSSATPSPEPEDDTPGVDTVTPSPDEVHDAGDDHGGDRPAGADDSSGHGGDDGSGHGDSDDSSGHGGDSSGSGSGGGGHGGDDHSGHGGGDD